MEEATEQTWADTLPRVADSLQSRRTGAAGRGLFFPADPTVLLRARYPATPHLPQTTQPDQASLPQLPFPNKQRVQRTPRPHPHEGTGRCSPGRQPPARLVRGHPAPPHTRGTGEAKPQVCACGQPSPAHRPMHTHWTEGLRLEPPPATASPGLTPPRDRRRPSTRQAPHELQEPGTSPRRTSHPMLLYYLLSAGRDKRNLSYDEVSLHAHKKLEANMLWSRKTVTNRFY